jgi:hypothetical protein
MLHIINQKLVFSASLQVEAVLKACAVEAPMNSQNNSPQLTKAETQASK